MIWSLLEHLRALAAIGIDHVLLGPRGPWDDATLEAVASILPEVHAIPGGVSGPWSGGRRSAAAG